MNLLVDENLSPSIVQRLAAKGIPAVHVAHIGLPGATDPDVWRYGSSIGCEGDEQLVNKAVVVTGPGRFECVRLPR